jgi:pimeloyl-ACP methyl ester carboxylesterase
MRRILCAWVLLCVCGAAAAQNARFTLLGTESVAQLDEVLTTGREHFLPPSARPTGYQWPRYRRAKYPVAVYRVDYRSVIPELHREPIEASGLLAIPLVPGAHALPVLSYQHGTVFGRYQVPSYAFSRANPSGYPQYSGAFEARLIVAQYAGQGYVVMAPDYFGLGDSNQPEAYTLKASEQQACIDLYRAATAFLARRGIGESRLFLGGWSQGGLVTTAFLEKLQTLGIPVTASFTAASPNDPFAAMNAWLYHPTASDPIWESSIIALSLFSYQHYDARAGLVRSVIKPRYYSAFKRIYTRNYPNLTALDGLLVKIAHHQGGLLGYFRKPYENSTYLADSPFGKLLAASETYQEIFHSPLRMYYGTKDQVIRIAVAKLARRYQLAMGSHSVKTMKVVDADHHGTFLAAVWDSLDWFNSFR